MDKILFLYFQLVNSPYIGLTHIFKLWTEKLLKKEEAISQLKLTSAASSLPKWRFCRYYLQKDFKHDMNPLLKQQTSSSKKSCEEWENPHEIRHYVSLFVSLFRSMHNKHTIVLSSQVQYQQTPNVLINVLDYSISLSCQTNKETGEGGIIKPQLSIIICNTTNSQHTVELFGLWCSHSLLIVTMSKGGHSRSSTKISADVCSCAMLPSPRRWLQLTQCYVLIILQ